MAKLIKQESFALGEVDETLFHETGDQRYLTALSSAKNMFITSQNNLERRSGTTAVGSPLRSEFNKDFLIHSFEGSDSNWYSVVISQSGGGVLITIFKYVKNGDGVLVPGTYRNGRSQNVWDLNSASSNTDLGTQVRDYDITSADNFVVITHPNLVPRRIDIRDGTPMLTNIEFSVRPSLDFGEVNYSGFTFAVSGTVKGQTITATPPSGFSGNNFSDKWVGGLIIAQDGASASNPLAVCLITAVAVDSTTNVTTFTTAVLQPFATMSSQTSATPANANGNLFSVRQPVWDATPTMGSGTVGTSNFPSKCLFFKGRLWLAATPRNPMLVCASVSNEPNNFNVGVGNPTDAISFLVSSSEGGSVKNLAGGINLYMFTDKHQLAVTGGLDVGVTAQTFDPKIFSPVTSSDLKPLVFRDGIHFTTSDGRGIARTEETQKASGTRIVSTLAQHLVINPLSMAVMTIPDTQEEVLVYVNEDNSLVFYSYHPTAGVQAFTPCPIRTFGDDKIAAVTSIANRLYIITTKGRMAYYDKNILLDFTRRSTKTSGDRINIHPDIEPGTKIDFIYKLPNTKDDRTYYISNITVRNGNVIYLPPNIVPEGSSIAYGLSYTSEVSTLPLYSSAQGSFLKKRVLESWVQYNNSYDFQFNGVSVALQRPPAGVIWKDYLVENTTYEKNGTARLGSSGSYKQDHFLTLTQNKPYPMTIQTMSWLIEERIIR